MEKEKPGHRAPGQKRGISIPIKSHTFEKSIAFEQIYKKQEDTAMTLEECKKTMEENDWSLDLCGTSIKSIPVLSPVGGDINLEGYKGIIPIPDGLKAEESID